VAPHAEAGVVRVSAAPVSGPGGGQVELTVADSGDGFETASLEALTDDGGVGLSNTKRRLETLYGDRHAFELGVAAEGGARITIRLPVDPEARTVAPAAAPAAARSE
jgi:LytS/YehU family sensor histidine kinase